MNAISDLWRYAYAAYKSDPANPLFSGGVLEEFKRGGQGYAYGLQDIKNNRIIVAFRGTIANVKDWARNFKFVPNSQGIHTGFADEWAMFAEDVKNFVAKSLKDGLSGGVYVTGHSQGGATAIICSKALSDGLGIQVSCINFAAPKAGNKDYRNSVNISPIDVTCVVNGYDIVPTLPPAAVGARQPGKVYWLAQPFWHAMFCKISDHLPEHYDEAVRKQLLKEIK